MAAGMRECVANPPPIKEDAFRLMRLIEANPKATQRELAAAAGISLGKAHYILRSLVDRGLVKLQRFGASKNKRAYSYVLTPSGFRQKAAVASRFLALKRAEYDALANEIEELSGEIRARD